MIDTKNTRKALNILNQLGGNVQEVKDITGKGYPYNGTFIIEGANIRFEVDCSDPAVTEAVYVHEILEGILVFEGWASVLIDEAKAKDLPPDSKDGLNIIKSSLHSVIAHPEVIRRMHGEFQLDMDSYLDMEAGKKRALLTREIDPSIRRRDLNYTFCIQQKILWGLDCFNYGEERIQSVFSDFHNCFPEARGLSQNLHDRIAYGFGNAADALKSGKAIVNDLNSYAVRKSHYLLNNLWNALDIHYGAKTVANL